MKIRQSISILIPCHNEEKSIAACVRSCLNQTRPADEVLVIDDGSTDDTPNILRSFGDQIRVVRQEQASGNKSYAQEIGLRHLTGDIFIATDGDTILDRNFVERVAIDFEDESIAAVSGYVKSLEYNWLTACRQIDYVIGQNFHKQAQSYLNFLMVIPGAAGAFRTDIFKRHIKFDHDTITEDLDFTYKLHELDFRIKFDKQAIVYTQDPTDLISYIKQMRRWFGGGWQNIVKHFNILSKPGPALEISLTYLDGLAFTFLIFIMPFINIRFYAYYALFGLFAAFIFTVYAMIISRRLNLIFYFPFYTFITFINAAVFVLEFFRVVVFRQRDLVWITPKRKRII